jgi:hypothetical protein
MPLLFENRTVYDIMWKNEVKTERNYMTVRRMRCVCCITKATDTQLECVILTAFPRWSSYANASHYFYTSTASLVWYSSDAWGSYCSSSVSISGAVPSTVLCSVSDKCVCSCLNGMARPQVADGGTASNMEGSCEYIVSNCGSALVFLLDRT